MAGAQFVRTTPEGLPEEMYDEIERKNWYDFACILLVLVGTFNVIDGISAVSDSKYVTDQVIFSSLHAWGWFFLIWGALQIVAAFAAYRGAGWAIVLAIVTAFFNAISHLGAARMYPVWSILIITIDVLVMYGLIVHRGTWRKQPT
jgi:hypothetical protein